MKTKTDKPNKKIEWLQRKHDEQGLTVAEKDSLIALQQARLAFLEEQFRLAKHKLFASQNEAHPEQGHLFNEAEEMAEQALEQDNSEPPKDKSKRKRNTKPFGEHVAREVVIHDIDEADKICTCCQGELHCMGKDITEKLVFVPATTLDSLSDEILAIGQSEGLTETEKLKPVKIRSIAESEAKGHIQVFQSWIQYAAAKLAIEKRIPIDDRVATAFAKAHIGYFHDDKKTPFNLMGFLVHLEVRLSKDLTDEMVSSIKVMLANLHYQFSE